MYFSEHKFAVEIDEKGHIHRNQDEEKQKQKKHSDFKFFQRINPVAEGLDSFLEINKIQNYITQSNEKKTKKQIHKIIIQLHMQHF